MDTQALKRNLIDALERECRAYIEPAANSRRCAERPTAVRVIAADYSEHTTSLAYIERDGDTLAVLSLYSDVELNSYKPGTWRAAEVLLHGEPIEHFTPTVHEFDESDLALGREL